MNPNAIIAEDLGSTTLTIDANPLPLRLPVGSALFGVRGKVWLTQEKMTDDVIVRPGERFDVRRKDLIVVSAIGGDAVLYVAQPADARADATEDVYAFLTDKARRLRTQRMAVAGSGLRERIAQAARRLRELGSGRGVLSH